MPFVALQEEIPAFAAGAETGGAYQVGVVPGTFAETNYTVTKIGVTASTLVTGATATQLTLTFRQMRAGSSVQTLGTLVTATGTNLPLETEVNVPITGTAGVLAGDIIDCLVTHASTGTASTGNILVRVELQ